MKKILLSLVCMLGVAFAASAESGDLELGVQLGHASADNQEGIGVKLQVGLTDEFRLEPSFNYYFRNNDVSSWDINLNLHYLFDVTENINVYPLAGIFYSGWKMHGFAGLVDDGTLSRFGADLGGGVDFAVSSSVSLTGELKYMFMKDFSQLVTSVGVKFKF